MAEVKWIKLDINVFDNRKIRQIELMPDGDAIVCIWLKLLCLAGNINDSGLIYFTPEIPYTEQMLAAQFNRPLATVQMAMQVFQQFNMIDVVNDILHISNWEKYQNTDKLEQMREQTRLRVAKYREQQKICNVTCNADVTQCNATEEDKEKDKEKELDKEKESKKPARHKYGEYSNVLLSDEELEKWKLECPMWSIYIKSLSEYMASSGKSYKNHLATLRTWYRKDQEKQPKKVEQAPNEASYDRSEYFDNFKIPQYKSKG